MTKKRTDLSKVEGNPIPRVKKGRIGIVVSEWNKNITQNLLDGAVDALISSGISNSNIRIEWVPGSFELPLAAQFVAKFQKIDAVICLGCVIQGETRHFEFISQSVADGIMKVGLEYNIPVIFGVLTTNTMEQAVARAGGSHGNKGVEAAITAVKMIALKDGLKDD